MEAIMTKRQIGTTVLAIVLAGLTDAGAWGSANRFGGSSFQRGEGGEHSNAWGGSTEHAAGGGTEHTNAYGGSSEGKYGSGAEHTNAYGGSTAGRYGSGAEHTNVYGGTTYGAAGDGAYHAPRPMVRPRIVHPLTAPIPPIIPVAVPYYANTCTQAALLLPARSSEWRPGQRLPLPIMPPHTTQE